MIHEYEKQHLNDDGSFFDMYIEIIVQGKILGEKQIVSDIKIMVQINKYA